MKPVRPRRLGGHRVRMTRFRLRLPPASRCRRPASRTADRWPGNSRPMPRRPGRRCTDRGASAIGLRRYSCRASGTSEQYPDSPRWISAAPPSPSSTRPKDGRSSARPTSNAPSAAEPIRSAVPTFASEPSEDSAFGIEPLRNCVWRCVETSPGPSRFRSRPRRHHSFPAYHRLARRACLARGGRL